MNNTQLEQLEHTLDVVTQTHRFDFIIDTARQILAIDPQHETATYQLIRALYHTEQIDTMFESLQFSSQYFANRSWIHYLYYLYYLHQGGAEYIKAKEHIEEAIRLQPKDPQYYRELGEIYLINREPDKASIHLSKAVELCPTNPEYRSRLALSLLRMHKVHESIQMADKALLDGANDSGVFDSVGMIYTLSGDLDKGEELFRVALRMLPTYNYYQKHIDWVLREKQDRKNRQTQNRQYTPLYLRHKGTKLFFDEDKQI
jgi:tetratricopeptide (TPR) repeat protein